MSALLLKAGAWFSSIWLKVAIIGGIALTGLIILGRAIASIKETGRIEEVKRGLEDVAKSRQVADETENRVAGADDAERERLRNKWTKPNP